MSENAVHEIRMRCLELARTLVSPSVDKIEEEVIRVARNLYDKGILCNDGSDNQDTPRRGKRRGPRRPKTDSSHEGRSGSQDNGSSPNEGSPRNVTA